MKTLGLAEEILRKGNAMYRLITLVAAMFIVSAPLQASDSDDQIEKAAHQSYVFKNYLRSDNIKIESRDGVVTLSGTVADESHRTLAEETVRNIPGVKSVNNQISYSGTPVISGSDAWLKERVKNTMLLHRDVSHAYSGVTVTDGNVTLHGLASSEEQKQLTTEYARQVSGVKSVENKMTVAQSLANPPRTSEALMDDASITTQVRMSLDAIYGTNEFAARVTSRDGIVTLGGKAKSQSEIDFATKFVGNINGVRGVKNLMIVEVPR